MRVPRSGRSALLGLLGVTLAACAADEITGPHYPLPSPEARAFIESQHLPLRRTMERWFLQDEVEVFGVFYGHPYDCPSGCAYSSAVGLRRAGSVGWIRLNDVEGFEPDSASLYDVTPADSALWRPGLWERMRASESMQSWFWPAFLPVIARDPQTEAGVLLETSRMLYHYISPHVAWQLLRNPAVQQDRATLTVLAALPVFRGDSYATARIRAEELLRELPEINRTAGYSAVGGRLEFQLMARR